MPRVASLDLGTNTFRLLIADLTDRGDLTPLLRKRVITRLGEGLHKDGTIQPHAVNRAANALLSFSSILDDYQAEQVFAVATSALREAKNGETITHILHSQTGIPIRTLTGREEAHLTLKGVFSAVQVREKLSLVVDIGGGSTELTLSEDTLPVKTDSINLGVVHLTEGLLTSDPPSQQNLDLLHEQIRKNLSSNSITEYLAAAASTQHPLTLIGTAGTVTTLAAIDQRLVDYDPLRINNYSLSRTALKTIYTQLTSLPLSERALIPGLEKGREDLIVPGTAILLEIMNRFQCTDLMVSDAGLLEGILLEHRA
jgi:exopolyphosphatase/guanosine-5'-triphosphate,3'-diphosphate pyrophosphatase